VLAPFSGIETNVNADAQLQTFLTSKPFLNSDCNTAFVNLTIQKRDTQNEPKETKNL